jgi:prepilin-type N-terminal cleavage/methylation domain-containing protein
MNRFRNKGVTLIEIIISVAIFGILMVPIVSKLIQSMKIADTAKTAQNRYELAENMMENVKNSDTFSEANIADSSNNCNDSYLKSISVSGSDVKVYKSTGKKSAAGTHDWDGYIVVGKTEVGSKKTEYNYAIALDNEEYANLEDSNTGNAATDYVNPNNMSLAMIENLDATKVALINGTIGNYDLTVTSAFMSKKLDVLKVGDKTRWEQYTKQQADIVAFPNDTVTRVIEVAVKNSKDGSQDAYTVTCTLKYVENSTVVLKDGVYAGRKLSDYLDPIEYVPYEQTFTGKLPNIYLMYNPCLYNSNYMKNDYILLDTSGLDASTITGGELPKVNLFVVETAESYSDETYTSYVEVMKETIAERIKSETDTATKNKLQTAYDKTKNMKADDIVTLIAEEKEKKANNTSNMYDALALAYGGVLTDTSLINTDSIRDRSQVTVNILGRGKSSSDDTSSYVTIYNNFDETDTTEKNKKNVVTEANLIGVNPITSEQTNCYKLDASQLKGLSEAQTAASGLYNVKIYLTKQDITATSYDGLISELSGLTPAITGTKGGNLGD